LGPAEYGEAAAIEAIGIRADGIPSGSSATGATLEAAAESPVALTDAFAASSAERQDADIKKMANAAAAIIFVVDLIVASRTARRDHPKSERRVNSTRKEHAKYRTCLKPR
jgi:hypothetical protein